MATGVAGGGTGSLTPTASATAGGEAASVPLAPVPRPFPVTGEAPGPRCGHTLTALAVTPGDVSGAKLVMFGTPPRPTPRSLPCLSRHQLDNLNCAKYWTNRSCSSKTAHRISPGTWQGPGRGRCSRLIQQGQDVL